MSQFLVLFTISLCSCPDSFSQVRIMDHYETYQQRCHDFWLMPCRALQLLGYVEVTTGFQNCCRLITVSGLYPFLMVLGDF